MVVRMSHAHGLGTRAAPGWAPPSAASWRRATTSWRRERPGQAHREVPFPEMGPALQKGDVDAAFSIEPFVTQSVGDGAKVLNYSYVETESGMLPEWTGEVDAGSIQNTAELMQRHGLVDETVPADKLVGGSG